MNRCSKEIYKVSEKRFDPFCSRFKANLCKYSNVIDLEQIRVQLRDQHFLDSESENAIPFDSPSQMESSQSTHKKVQSINGGDKGGSSILRRSEKYEKDSKSDYESAIMPRKLNLKIHTNIDDNFDIQSSEGSSIISNIHEDPNQMLWDKQSMQVTGETCVIICDAEENQELCYADDQNYLQLSTHFKRKSDQEVHERSINWNEELSEEGQNNEDSKDISHQLSTGNHQILIFRSEVEVQEQNRSYWWRELSSCRISKSGVYFFIQEFTKASSNGEWRALWNISSEESPCSEPSFQAQYQWMWNRACGEPLTKSSSWVCWKYSSCLWKSV